MSKNKRFDASECQDIEKLSSLSVTLWNLITAVANGDEINKSKQL